MERDARYATLALFALACIAAAVAFVWWYSGRGDQRDYRNYEIYFQGTVSGLSKGSPVRYLGVDVGRVTALGVDKQDAGRVKVVAEIDHHGPDLRRDAGQARPAGPDRPALHRPAGESRRAGGAGARAGGPLSRDPVAQGHIEASIERLPEILGQATAVLASIERVLLGGATCARSAIRSENIERASRDLPAADGRGARAGCRTARHLRLDAAS